MVTATLLLPVQTVLYYLEMLCEYIRVIVTIVGLPMTRIELEKVADVFFPDRRALHLVDVSEIVAKLTQKHDWKKVENESDAVKIEREVISYC